MLHSDRSPAGVRHQGEKRGISKYMGVLCVYVNTTLNICKIHLFTQTEDVVLNRNFHKFIMSWLQPYDDKNGNYH